MLLGIDLGTTHCKAGLFRLDGTLLHSASLPTPLERDAQGQPFYPPEGLWQRLCQLIRQVTASLELSAIKGVGIAGMAESGLLVDAQTGEARCPLLPWHSTQSRPFVALLKQAAPALESFQRSGIHPSAKCPLSKLLYLQAQDAALLQGARWLSAPDYMLYRLTGAFVTDYSLAGRSLAFDIRALRWDEAWLAALGLPRDLFPAARPAGTAFPAHNALLAPETPVCIAGHDHVCAALAVGAVQPEIVLDSMGTAETLLGAWQPRPLSQQDYDSGLLFGCHVVPGWGYWMGSLSASGGALEWLRGLLGGMDYAAMEAAMQQLSEPGDILFLPYLRGSSQQPDAKAAFIGLEQQHQPAHLLKAVAEGTAYEMELLRETVQNTLAIEVQRSIVVGGGTRNRAWMQIKADVSGALLQPFPLADATLLGAAMLAGIAAGQFRDAAQALAQMSPPAQAALAPDPQRQARYQQLYQRGYRPLRQALGDYYVQAARQ